jgi:hypothetical protein
MHPHQEGPTLSEGRGEQSRAEQGGADVQEGAAGAGRAPQEQVGAQVPVPAAAKPIVMQFLSLVLEGY